MTALRTLAAAHFRSHRLARLETDGRSVALFGPNGAGKTNLLEAVSLLSPGRGLRRADEIQLHSLSTPFNPIQAHPTPSNPS